MSNDNCCFGDDKEAKLDFLFLKLPMDIKKSRGETEELKLLVTSLRNELYSSMKKINKLEATIQGLEKPKKNNNNKGRCI